jgi:HEAT repeat protein
VDRKICRIGRFWQDPMPWERLDPSLIPYVCDIGEHDPELYIRSQAAYALSRFNDPCDCEALIAQLNCREASIRSSVIYALGKTGDPRACEPLAKLLDSEGGVWRENAALALAKLGDERAIGPLVEYLIHYKSDDVRWVEFALGKMKNDRVVSPLLQLLHHQDERVRRHATSALTVRILQGTPCSQRKNQSPESDPGRVELLAAASEAVLACGRGEAPEHLKRLLSSQNASVREAAETALKRIEAMQRQFSETQPATCPGS